MIKNVENKSNKVYTHKTLHSKKLQKIMKNKQKTPDKTEIIKLENQGIEKNQILAHQKLCEAKNSIPKQPQKKIEII